MYVPSVGMKIKDAKWQLYNIIDDDVNLLNQYKFRRKQTDTNARFIVLKQDCLK